MVTLSKVTCENLNKWQKTIPNILEPFPGESLYGYLLRIDSINNFTPGTLMDKIKIHSTGRLSLNRPGLFICGTIFDLENLASLSGLTMDTIYNLTIINTLKRLFRLKYVYPELAGYSNEFQICPICIKEKRLPLIHLFKNINTCIKHEVFLRQLCECGSGINLFSPLAKCYSCPVCSKPFGNLNTISVDINSEVYLREKYLHNAYESVVFNRICFVNDDEELSQGFEDRLQIISYKQGIDRGMFKKVFGFETGNMINGHGPVNISLAKILDILYVLGYTPDNFRDIEIDKSTRKIVAINVPDNSGEGEHTCPNKHCKYFMALEKGNIKFYGKKKNRSEKYLIEEYCNECGTRFVGNNIIQSYDYNPGLRQYDIEKARGRINRWQNELSKVCEEMIERRIPITLTGCFKRAKIPIGKTYFVNRLGLIEILERYAKEQRANVLAWANEMSLDEINDFGRRIFRKRKISECK